MKLVYLIFNPNVSICIILWRLFSLMQINCYSSKQNRESFNWDGRILLRLESFPRLFQTFQGLYWIDIDNLEVLIFTYQLKLSTAMYEYMERNIFALSSWQ